MNKRIGVSVASYAPFAPFLTKLAMRWAKKDGFGFVCMLPFRGAGRITDSPMIRYVEDAWNPVWGLREALSGKPTSKGLVPNIVGHLFFPDPVISQRFFMRIRNFDSSPTIVVHSIKEWNERRLLEVSPRIDMGPKAFVEWAMGTDAGLVLDTRHLRRPVWKDLGEKGKELGPWEKLIPDLLPFTRLVHVQPKDQDELATIMRGKKTELHLMLQKIREGGFTGDFMVEATLGVKGIMLWKLRQMLRAMRQFIEDNAF